MKTRAVYKKEQRFRKIRRKSVFSGIFILLIVLLLLEVAVVVGAVAMGNAVFTSRIGKEYEGFAAFAELYESSETADEELWSRLDSSGRTYIIKDQNGNIIHQNGSDTMSGRFGTMELIDSFATFSARDGKALPGIDVHLGTADEKERVSVSGLDIVTVKCYEDMEESAIYSAEGDISVNYFGLIPKGDFFNNRKYRSNDVISVHPVWVAIDVKDGKETLYGKAFLSVTGQDFSFAFALSVGVVSTVLVVLAVMVVNIVSTVRNQMKMTMIFLTDDSTRGHNWMWFLIKAGNYIRKKRHDKFNYAVLDFVFVNYRNYCMCHSIEEGEELLTRVDGILRANTNRWHEFVAHYASANFAVLLRYGSDDEFRTRVDDILSKLMRVDPEQIFQFHIGVKLLPAASEKNGKFRRRKATDLEVEYNDACTARATLVNNDSSGIAFYDEKLVEDQKWNDVVRASQEKALTNEEFLVYYQPKYDPKTNRLSGAEALIRWDSPEYGFKGPGAFIPIFEKNGFIKKIDHYMLTHVARDQKRWFDAGLSCVPVSVNISRAHFIEPDLAEQIRDTVDREGAPHELIEIELTESAFFDDKIALINTINKLKEYGFAVSMDDFGSGYSSLNSLKDMPLDVLKLDAEFFRGNSDGGRGEIVVSEAISLAKRLNMKTVAEGVEAKDQVDFLAAQGCDMIQGYYYAKPMPGKDYEQRMTSVH